MITEKGEIILRESTLPKGVPFVNLYKFRNMPQKCHQCQRVLKNKKKYYLGKIVEFDNGFWTYEKICKQCNHPNVVRLS